MTRRLSTSAISPRRPALTGSRRRLLLAVGGLLALDVVGGLLAVAHDLNTFTGAWGSAATLAAPVQMMAGQALLALAAAHWPDRRGATAGLLAAASLVSGISGFFDGQFARPDLPAPLIGVPVPARRRDAHGQRARDRPPAVPPTAAGVLTSQLLSVT